MKSGKLVKSTAELKGTINVSEAVALYHATIFVRVEYEHLSLIPRSL